MPDRMAHSHRVRASNIAESSTMAQNRNPTRSRDDDPSDLKGLESRVISEFKGIGIDVVDERIAATRRASRAALGDIIEDGMSGRDVEPPSYASRREALAADLRRRRRARGSSELKGPTPKEVVERKIRQLKKKLEDTHLDAETRKELSETLHWHEQGLADRIFKEDFVLKYGEKWEVFHKETRKLQELDEPTPEIGRLWLDRHELLDSPVTGKWHWRDKDLGRRVPANEAAKDWFNAIEAAIKRACDIWMEKYGVTKDDLWKIEREWQHKQHLLDKAFVCWHTFDRDYHDCLVEPIDCSPIPPPTPGRRRRFLNFVKDLLPRRSTAESLASDAHSLGVGEGSYRMRRRYFDERY
ncbi:hypothetical protein JCM9279_001758 [Rhodotorula babjevae]